MKILNTFKPEKCVSKDPTRQALFHAFVDKTGEKKGFLNATNGIMAVRIPVDLEENETEGAIPVEAIKQSRKICSKESEHLEFTLSEKVMVQNQEVKSEYDRFNYLTFPKIQAVFPKTKPKAFIAFNAAYLKCIADALGTEMVFLEIRNSHEAIIVRPNNESDCKAALMPCTISRKTGEEKQEKIFDEGKE